MPPYCRVFVFVTTLVSGGVPDIICVAQITSKFVDHALIVDNRGLLLFNESVPHVGRYRGNNQKINSAHILRLGRPWCETNHDIFRLAEYRLIYEKISNNRIPSKCRFWCSNFKKNLEASRHKMKQPRPIKTIKSWQPTSKLMLTAIWAILVNLFFKIELNCGYMADSRSRFFKILNGRQSGIFNKLPID